jgi:hypothetical protein
MLKAIRETDNWREMAATTRGDKRRDDCSGNMLPVLLSAKPMERAKIVISSVSIRAVEVSAKVMPSFSAHLPQSWNHHLDSDHAS